MIVANHDTEVARLTPVLAEDGYDVVGPTEPLHALRICSTERPAAILVDVELRDLSVGEFCALARGRAGAHVPVLLFGAPQVAPLSAAFAGADAYVPVSDPSAIKHRLRTLIGRGASDDEEPLVAHYEGRHLRARFDRVEILVDGVRVDLARRELALLQFLVTHTNRVLGRTDLLAHVWHDRSDQRSRTIDTHIRRLRVKLRAAGKQIQTVPGVGYRFTEI